MVMTRHSARLKEMKKRFKVQPELAKKPYMTPVRVIANAYMAAVEPTRMYCHIFELVGEFSHLSRHISEYEWAKSTRRTRPRSMKIVAPIRET